MKKILFTIMIFFSFSLLLKAECTYKDQKEYSLLASNVSYKIDYNESTGLFDVTFYNLEDPLVIRFDGINQYKSNKETTLSRIAGGTALRVYVEVSGTTCAQTNMRKITVNVPYVNIYYGSEDCKGHEDLKVCSSRFLDYQITTRTFNSLIIKDQENKYKKENEVVEEEVKEETALEKVVSVFREIYIPLIIIIISSLVVYLIMLSIYRKVKYGI